MRLLVVEDSEILRRSICRALRFAGFAVDAVANGEEGLDEIELHSYDAVILDIMLPRLDGLTVLRRLRAARNQTHILLLTAKDTVKDRVEGLRLGADDYLVKPFAMEELIARAEALCRRNYGEKTTALQLGPLKLDFSARQLLVGESPVALTAREWRLLEYLALRQGQVVRRMEIEAHIYDELVEPMSNVVDSTIYALRRKIGAHFIQTRRGLGYVFTAPAS